MSARGGARGAWRPSWHSWHGKAPQASACAGPIYVPPPRHAEVECLDGPRSPLNRRCCVQMSCCYTPRPSIACARRGLYPSSSDCGGSAWHAHTDIFIYTVCVCGARGMEGAQPRLAARPGRAWRGSRAWRRRGIHFRFVVCAPDHSPRPPHGVGPPAAGPLPAAPLWQYQQQEQPLWQYQQQEQQQQRRGYQRRVQ
mgnify:CR=1 FL=1